LEDQKEVRLYELVKQLLPLILVLISCGRDGEKVVVGSKNFTESVLLGEIVAQQLERHGLEVDRRFNLGGTFICHRAMVAGQLDTYVEYTGTAHSAILELATVKDPARVRTVVDSVYRERWGIVWSPPLGFNNTFALLIRGEAARRLGLETLSDAAQHASQWRLGAGYEFIERADGYHGLVAEYGMSFDGQPLEMDLGLTYRALAEGRVDMIAGNATDGQIAALDLFHLQDDRGYFPPYEAVPLVRREALDRYPVIAEALDGLAGAITDADMIRLNRQVDVDKRDVREVVREFLRAGSEGGQDD
jgi:glycine betaine/choline ABC-type transport system substrate-binding protein